MKIHGNKDEEILTIYRPLKVDHNFYIRLRYW